jgi:hypothetical protein
MPHLQLSPRPLRFLAGLSFASCLTSCLLLTACVTEEPLTGSVDAVVLAGSSFTVTERVQSTTQLIARGTVKNNGSKTWSPVWIVEGEFYADSTYSLKLGGAVKYFNFSLEKGTATSWELRFTSSDFDVSDYPKFAVRNLRVTQQ